MDHERATEAGAGAVGRMERLAQCADPIGEDRYWHEHYSERPYVARGSSWDDYAPAYRYGVDAYARYGDRSFDEVESDLATGWNTARQGSKLDWTEARMAVRDAWRRVGEAMDRPSSSNGQAK